MAAAASSLAKKCSAENYLVTTSYLIDLQCILTKKRNLAVEAQN